MNVAPLTGSWAALVAAIIATGFVFHFSLRHKGRSTRRRALLIFAFVNLGFSITFHLAYMISPPPEGFPVFENLPLQLCTLMSWLMPLAVWFDWKPLRAVAFFPGALAGLGALFSAAPMYWHYNLFDPHTFFWVSHGFNAVIPMVLASLQLYRPRLKDAVLSAPYVAALALMTLPITLVLRAWVDRGADYFYVFDPMGAKALVFAYNILPVPIIYLIPLLIAAIPIFIGQWGVYRLMNRRHVERDTGANIGIPISPQPAITSHGSHTPTVEEDGLSSVAGLPQ